MVEITQAIPEDAITIHAMQQRAFAEEGRLSGTRRLPPLMETAGDIESLIRTVIVLVARLDGQIVGSIRGIPKETVCTIRAVMVEPSHHGRGIGGTLLEAIERAHPHVERFELTTNTLVPGNVQFYERRGYVIYETTQLTDKVLLAQMRKPARSAPVR